MSSTYYHSNSILKNRTKNPLIINQQIIKTYKTVSVLCISILFCSVLFENAVMCLKEYALTHTETKGMYARITCCVYLIMSLSRKCTIITDKNNLNVISTQPKFKICFHFHILLRQTLILSQEGTIAKPDFPNIHYCQDRSTKISIHCDFLFLQLHILYHHTTLNVMKRRKKWVFIYAGMEIPT